tara:strand:- start:858 stop:2570 length:1713 start_codon:yes stop_codon:yes gene_type:complete
MRKYLFYLLFFLLLGSPALSKMSLDQQRSLINSNAININLNCSNLLNRLGGFQGAITYSIGDAKKENHSYVLLHTHVKKENNIYYLCKQNRYDYASSESIDDQLKDQNLHKIFYDSYEMVKYVFTVADEDFTRYMMSKFYLSDYNLERNQLIIAFTEAQAEIIGEQNQMSDKEKKALEKKEKREKIREEQERKEAEEKRLAKSKPTKSTGTSDTTPPKIKIASTITVNDAKYSLQGEVTDKGSKKIYVNVKDEYSQNSVKVVNGKFTIHRFSPDDEEIQIIATDSWGNKSEKTVKVKIKRKVVQPTIVVEKLDPTKVKSRKLSNKVALIIGVQNYSSAPKATFAASDAKWFYEYAKNVFGVSENNIKKLVNKDASFIQTQKVISKWLPSKIKANQTELIVFFAGHGLSTPDGKELYLLVHDSDTDLLSRTAISRSELFNDIVKLKPKSVTLFFDTCYSGSSRDDESLLVAARPIRILPSEVSNRPDNFTIFSAAKNEQISSGFKEARHGIFSYYLMKGLEGKADANKDKQITNGELHVYMDKHVSQKALELGRKQNPDLAGDHKQILTRY